MLTSIDAVRPSDTWLAGSSFTPKFSRLRAVVEHWNGTAWQAVRLPGDRALFTGQAFFGASSDRAAWAFSSNGSYLRLSGQRWQAGRMPGTRGGHVVITSARVFSRTDAWAFGSRLIGHLSKLDFVPYAARWNGERWTKVPVPDPGRGGIAVSALSPRDMWALAGGKIPDTGLPFRARILHWNGQAWSPVSVQPKLPRHGDLDSIMALSDSDVWVGGAAPDGHGGTTELAVHWNGSSWTPGSPAPKPSGKQYFLGGLAPDGHGGFWGVSELELGASRMWHWTAGRWTGPGKPRWDIFQLAAVPGTRSVWGIAEAASLNSGLIVLHGPVPH